jgi:hypothetical protein
MIAEIHFQLGEEPAIATLGDDATWTIAPPDPLLTDALNLIAQTADRSPARGNWAQWHAEQVSQRLDGTVTYAPTDPVPAGLVY